MSKKKPVKEEPQHITTHQLAKRWHMNPVSIQNWRMKKKGPAYLKVGKRVLYEMSVVKVYEQSCIVAPKAKARKKRA